jgi:hypothetical protein
MLTTEGLSTAPTAVPRRWWFTPAVFILTPVVMSFTMWTLLAVWIANGDTAGLWEKLAGFSEPATPSVPGIALLVLFYAAVVSVAVLGFRLGSGGTPNAKIVARTSTVSFERRYFLMITAVAAVGVGYCYFKIASSSSILDSLSSQEGNAFTNSLSGSAGLETFRYATILAAPVGIHLWQKKVIAWPFMVVAVTLLLMDSMIAHRLAILMASFVYLVIWVKKSDSAPRKKPRSAARRWLAVAAIFLIGFTLLGALNFFRNANYYREAGVTNPAAMNFYQMGAYLGVPAQVSIGVSEAIMRGDWEERGNLSNSTNAVQPTFLQFDKVSKDDSWKGAEVYGYSATFEPSFFTNSVFADTYSSYGMWGWFYTILLYGLAGYLFARIFQYSVVISGTAGVIAYTLSEVWRIQIVSYGFVIFLVILTAGCAYVAALWSERADAKKRKAADVSSRRHDSAQMVGPPSKFGSPPVTEPTGRHRRPDR